MQRRRLHVSGDSRVISGESSIVDSSGVSSNLLRASLAQTAPRTARALLEHSHLHALHRPQTHPPQTHPPAGAGRARGERERERERARATERTHEPESANEQTRTNTGKRERGRSTANERKQHAALSVKGVWRSRRGQHCMTRAKSLVVLVPAEGVAARTGAGEKKKGETSSTPRKAAQVTGMR